MTYWLNGTQVEDFGIFSHKDMGNAAY